MLEYLGAVGSFSIFLPSWIAAAVVSLGTSIFRAKGIPCSRTAVRRKIFTAVGQFNNQRQQCLASRKAMEIASERYELMMDKFRRGSATVTDLTNAQNDNESAMAKYITDYSNFWTYYYTLRKYALYDFITGKDIDVSVKEMVE